MTIALYPAILLALAAPASAAPAPAPNPLGMRTYAQEFTLEFATPEIAARARLEKLPLPDGKTWAFSGRWDDNNAAHSRMRDTMRRHGYKASFYLNASAHGKPDTFGAGYARKLIEGGFSIGGHTMTHPKLPELDRNEMFWQVLAVRVEREAQTDVPINSFAFPYGQFAGPAHADIGEALARAGYHHNVYGWFIVEKEGISPLAVSSVRPVNPGDRDPDPAKFEKDVEGNLANAWARGLHPNLTLGVHVWHTEEGWKHLEECLAKYAHRPDWWYCNQTEYAAYRYQFHHAQVEVVAREGRSVRCRVTRPLPADLGDGVPLTLEVLDGTPQAIQGPGAKHALAIQEGRAFLNLAHDAARALPARVDAIENRGNAAAPGAEHVSTDFPGVRFFLHCDREGGRLRLMAENKSAEPLRDVSVTFRLPLAYAPGVRRRPLPDIAPGAAAEITEALGDPRPEPVYQAGSPYFVAQVEFRAAAGPGRIYATTRVK